MAPGEPYSLAHRGGGLVAGIVGGALGGLLHAIATVAFSVDHIVSGVAINILAPGTARYLSERVFTQMDGGSISQSPRVESLGDFTWPILAKGPDLLGKVERLDWFLISDIFGVMRGLLFQMTYLTAIGLALVPISAFLLTKTKFGLRLRIAGEKPLAGESLGINIYRQKFLGVIISGGLAGLAGSFIVLELAGLYRQNQTTGRGFIALAALIFGNWESARCAHWCCLVRLSVWIVASRSGGNGDTLTPTRDCHRSARRCGLGCQ